MIKFPGFPKDPTTNYWRYPKALNGWWHILTGSEQKALDFILRHTWGFKKNADYISYNQFINGVKNCDKGSGIKSSATLSKALNGLEKKGFIKREGGKAQSGRTRKYILSFNQGTLETKERTLESKQPSSLETKHTIKDKTIKDINNNNIHEQKVRVYKRLPLEKQQRVHRLCYHLEDLTGTKIVNWGKQGKGINQMMRAGFTEEEIKKAITYMAKSDEFFC